MSLGASGLLAAPVSTNYRLPWAVVDGGGGAAFSSNYRVAGSVQSNASLAATSANYILVSGFHSPPDTDTDTVRNFLDNCSVSANPNQLDSDQDGIGNQCDCDFNQDNFCGGPDFTLFIGCFNAPTGGDAICEAADMNGDGFVGGPDFTLFISGFNRPPGPSGLNP